MQQRDAVGPLRQPQAHVCHVEFGRIVLGAQRDDAVGRQPRQQPRPAIAALVIDVALHHLEREPVDPGGDGSMSGEHRAGPHHSQCGVEIQTRIGDQFTDAFDAEESGVALVHVEDLRRGELFDGGVRTNRPHPADAGQDLLFDAMFLVATVEAVGDVAQVVLVLRDIRIQQEQRNPTHLRYPDPGAQHGVVSQGDLDQHWIPVGVGEQTQRQPLRVQRWVGLVLPAVRGKRLPEVAGAVVQPHRDQRHAQIGRGFQMVAGENPKTARVIRQHLGYPELQREVRDPGRQGLCGYPGVLLLLIPQRTAQVVVQVGRQLIEGAQKFCVQRKFVETRWVHRAQQRHRIMTALLPQCRVDRREQILCRFVPGPPQIGRQLVQGGKTFG
ncbi:Uncharacterised protein [Mycobacterium tuberculosis]|nr:Uncharacterised protein [Mycobacterium tuberculosis]